MCVVVEGGVGWSGVGVEEEDEEWWEAYGISMEGDEEMGERGERGILGIKLFYGRVRNENSKKWSLF